MQRTSFYLCGALLLSLNFAQAEIPGLTAGARARTQALRQYVELRLQFEANAGQGDSRAQFLSRNGNYTLFLTAGGSNEDVANSIAADPAGNVYVAGGTNSSAFKTTAGTFQGAYQRDVSDGYLSKIAILEGDLGVTNSAPSMITRGGNLNLRLS